MNTTKAFRIALSAAALCAAGSLSGTAADAKPRRVVILDFDGPRKLADTSRSAVLDLVDDEYDIVSTKRWEKARTAGGAPRGPEGWRKASRKAGVDAIIEGWIQDEGRIKLLYVVVRDASNGNELDRVSVRLGKAGPTEANIDQIRARFEEAFPYIEASPEFGAKLPTLTDKEIETIRTKRSSDAETIDESADAPRRTLKEDSVARLDGKRGAGAELESDDGETTERKPVKVATAPSLADEQGNQDRQYTIGIFKPEPGDEVPTEIKNEFKQPWRTPRFALSAGMYYGARSFVAEGDTDDLDDYSARSKGLQLQSSVYPFPSKKMNGQLQGIGFTFGLYKSAGSEVGVTTQEEVLLYPINQNGFEGAVHYRQPLGIVSIDGEVGYSQHNYEFPADFKADVPDAQYSAFHAGAQLDLHVTDHAQVGFGAKLYYVLGNGDISSDGWYGPGNSSGFDLDASFQIPLPKQLFVRGELAYRRITNSFDSIGGIITEEEAVEHAADATINGSVNVGVAF